VEVGADTGHDRSELRVGLKKAIHPFNERGALVRTRSCYFNPSMLLLRKAGVAFYLEDLFGVTFAVGGNEKHPLVGIEFLAEGTVHGVSTKVLRFLEKGQRCSATLLEVLQAFRRRAVPIAGDQRFGCLHLV